MPRPCSAGMPRPCSARIAAQVDLVSLRPGRNAADACEDCSLQGLRGMWLMPARIATSEACKDRIDGSRMGYIIDTSIRKNYMWLDLSVRGRFCRLFDRSRT
ncbi:unnamed protein product [Prunus armeniaca]